MSVALHEPRYLATIEVIDQHVGRGVREAGVGLVGWPAHVRRQDDVWQFRERVPGR